MRDTFPFAFRASLPKPRQEADSWLQNIPKRFDNRKHERQNAKLNYGIKHLGNISAYIESYKNQVVQSEQIKQAKVVHKAMKMDHFNESKLLLIYLYSIDR